MIYPNKPLYLLSLLGYIYYLTYYTLTTKDNIISPVLSPFLFHYHSLFHASQSSYFATLKALNDVRAELIDGHLIFPEVPRSVHQELISELLFELKLYIHNNKGTCKVLPAPLDVQLDCNNRTMIQPQPRLHKKSF